MKLLTRVGRTFDRTNIVLASLSGALIILVMLLTGYMVVMRYIFHDPPGWVIEVTKYMLFIIPFLSAGWLLIKGNHVKIDLVIDRLKPKTRTVINLISSFIGAIICWIITWYGLEATLKYLQEGIRMTEVLAVPRFLLIAFIPFGCLMLSLEFIRQIYKNVVSIRTFRRNG